MRLTWEEWLRLQDIQNQYFFQEAGEIVGTDVNGRERATKSSRQFELAGRHWAQHVLESPIAWVIHALYIGASVGFGSPLVQTLAKNLLPGMGFNLDLGPRTVLGCAALEPDTSLYIFGLWMWTVALN